MMTKLIHAYKMCRLCPRNCGVNRLVGEIGFCGETSALRIGVALIHRGEEPPLVGNGGSGTIFVSGCNLGCSFCQNHQVSQREGDRPALGCEVSAEEFVKICTALNKNGAENINIVTGSHAIPAFVEGFSAAREHGIKIPILWNSSGYESIEALEMLKDHVDIYLPDLKTLDGEISAKYFNAPDYPETAAAAILKMINIKNNKPDKVIIRHLILPGHLESTRRVLRWFADNAATGALLSIMTQYTPVHGRSRPMPGCFVSEKDYDTVMSWLKEFDIEDGFCQELITGNEWLPDFKRDNPFSSELSVPVWYMGRIL